MDLFLTEEDYLPAEFDELPLDEAILRVREIEDERETSSRKGSKDGKGKRKRRDEDDEDEERSDGPDDQYSDDDGWLVNDLGDDGFMDEDEEDEDKVVTVKDGVKVFGADEAEEEDDGKGGNKMKKKKNDEEEKEKKPRRRINTGPRVVLNVDRLKNINALAALPEIQRKLHFKGKGHEEEDLARIMETMEHWAHRVMPRMKFDEFIEKAEQLGTKKILKAFVSKIRFGLSLDTNGDIPGIDFEALPADSDEEFAFDDDLPPMPPVNAEDAFDAIMREAEEVVKQRAAEAAAASAFSSPSVSGLQSTMTNLDLNKTLTPVRSTQPMSSQSTTPVTSRTPTSSSTSLTEEQRRKIAENARKAAEKRLALQMARSQPIPTSQPIPESPDIEL